MMGFVRWFVLSAEVQQQQDVLHMQVEFQAHDEGKYNLLFHLRAASPNIFSLFYATERISAASRGTYQSW